VHYGAEVKVLVNGGVAVVPSRPQGQGQSRGQTQGQSQ
jgi:hypothetical protein